MLSAGPLAAGPTPAAGTLDFDSVVTVVVDVIAAVAFARHARPRRCRHASCTVTRQLAASVLT